MARPEPANRSTAEPRRSAEEPAAAYLDSRDRWKIRCVGKSRIYRNDGSQVNWDTPGGATRKTKILFAYLMRKGGSLSIRHHSDATLHERIAAPANFSLCVRGDGCARDLSCDGCSVGEYYITGPVAAMILVQIVICAYIALVANYTMERDLRRAVFPAGSPSSLAGRCCVEARCPYRSGESPSSGHRAAPALGDGREATSDGVDDLDGHRPL